MARSGGGSAVNAGAKSAAVDQQIVMPHENAKEGQGTFDIEWLKSQPLARDALRKAVEYLKQDYACLGYKVPVY